MQCQYLDIALQKKDQCLPLGSRETVSRLETVVSVPPQTTSHTYQLEKEMPTHSSILAWKIPWTEEHGGPYSHKEVGPWGHKESVRTECLSI